MTLNEAMAQFGPSWLSIWLPILLAGGYVLPLLLLIWKSTRLTAVFCLIASGLGMVGTGMMYNQMGYVKLLSVPHIVFWTPLVIYLLFKIKSASIPMAPRVVMILITTVICISLAFDYNDFVRYILGERTALAMPPKTL